MVPTKITNFVTYKDAFLFQSQQDYKFLRSIITFNSYIGIVPKQNKCNGIIRNILIVLTFSSCVFLASLSEIWTLDLINILSLFEHLINILFLASVLLISNFVFTKKWRTFFTLIRKLEFKIQILEFQYRGNKTIYFQIIFMWMMFITFYLISFYPIYWTNKLWIKISWMIIDFYYINLFTLLLCITDFLAVRYDFVSSLILFPANSNFKRQHKNIVDFLKVADEIMEELNKLLSWSYFLIYNFTILDIVITTLVAMFDTSSTFENDVCNPAISTFSLVNIL